MWFLVFKVFKMLFKNDKVGFIILNVLRAMNIISLFAAIIGPSR